MQKFYEDNLAFVGNTAAYGADIRSVTTNNGFIYVSGNPESGVNRGVSKFREDNLALVSNTVNYGGDIYSVTTNNGFIYVGGENGTNSTTALGSTVKKFQEAEIIPETLTFYTATKIKE